ncbi:hypothetical protein [Candidatus Protofrankia datiscae]|uniref:hypothetical protein n=1 Tax=Candidatus Protofrankia datiscae TaxID=2716812 RepID=UPI0013EAEF21|nr:hypothetical protein [Candidatus Protofrankia datiscae]
MIRRAHCSTPPRTRDLAGTGRDAARTAGELPPPSRTAFRSAPPRDDADAHPRAQAGRRLLAARARPARIHPAGDGVGDTVGDGVDVHHSAWINNVTLVRVET